MDLKFLRVDLKLLFSDKFELIRNYNEYFSLSTFCNDFSKKVVNICYITPVFVFNTFPHEWH